MLAIDFITAFGRLLRDGAMRDDFASDPDAVAGRLNLRECDRAALMQLIPADLEFQARILIGKRLGIVRGIIPETCRLLGAETWPAFHAYARTTWPTGEPFTARDAHAFCLHLQHHQPDSLCNAELNRLQFAFSKKRLALHFIQSKQTRSQTKPVLQLLYRFDRQSWREATICFRL